MQTLLVYILDEHNSLLNQHQLNVNNQYLVMENLNMIYNLNLPNHDHRSIPIPDQLATLAAKYPPSVPHQSAALISKYPLHID